MSDTTQPGFGCAQFEGVLSEYREGTLPDALAALARQHVSQCSACTALVASIAEAQAHLAALPALDPPAHLLARILEQTLPHRAQFHGRRADPSGRRHGWSALWASLASPRFAMGVAMSVFAIALLLNAAQINLGQLFRTGNVEQLNPAVLTSAVSRNLNRAWARGVAYYHDLRVVYEIEAAIHQMREAKPANPGNGRNRSDRSLGPGEDLAQNRPPGLFLKVTP
ncbi:MAG: zf-HC2 domain-containing protein [Terriglobales bacterium]